MPPYSKIHYKVIPLARPERKIIRFQRYVGLTTEYEIVVRNMADAEIFLEKGHPVVLDLAEVEQISLDGMAYLLGNIEMLTKMYGSKLTGTYSNNPIVNQLLTDSGFFKHLKIKSQFGTSESDNNISHLKFRSENYIDAEIISPLSDEVTSKDISIPVRFQKKIFRALSEAMLNVHHHAYPGLKYMTVRRLKDRKGKWWLGAQYNKNDGKLSFVIYDMGQGIPATLPRNYKNTYIQKFTNPQQNCNDAELIFAATQAGKTSTNKKHRGKGLPDMHQIIENNRGELQIFSGYGHYFYANNNSFKTNRGLQCIGTLVIWTIDVDALTRQEIHK